MKNNLLILLLVALSISARGQLNLGTSDGKTIEPFAIGVSSGVMFFHDFGGEGDEFFGNLKLGPSYQLRASWRPPFLAWTGDQWYVDRFFLLLKVFTNQKARVFLHLISLLQFPPSFLRKPPGENIV